MRSLIVEVSLGLFARRGIDGVSISEIALASGVSKANVMHHFGSKNSLYGACLEVIDAHLHSAVDSAKKGESPVADLSDALESWAANRPDDCRVMAYGLLRLLDQPGRWALAGPVERMVDLVMDGGAEAAEATALVVDLLGRVTYREMARPIITANANRIPDTRS